MRLRRLKRERDPHMAAMLCSPVSTSATPQPVAAVQGAGGDDSPAAAAARALGADSVNITVDGVKNWRAGGGCCEAVERCVSCACWDLLHLASARMSSLAYCSFGTPC